MGQLERRRRERRGRGGPTRKPRRSGFQPMIPVKRGDDLKQRSDLSELAPVEPGVGHAQLLGEARHLQMNVAVRSVEPPPVDRAIDLAPNRLHADFALLRDLLKTPAGCKSLEGGFA